MLRTLTATLITFIFALSASGQNIYADSAIVILSKSGDFQKNKQKYFTFIASQIKNLDSLSKIKLVEANLKLTSSIASGKYLPFGYFIQGNIYMSLSDKEEAYHSYMQSYELSTQKHDTGTAINAAQSVAYFYRLWGDHQEEMRYSIIALELSEKTGAVRGISINAMNAGHSLKALKRYEEAIKYYRVSYLNATKEGNPTMVPNALISIGNGFLELRQMDSSLHYYYEAEKAAIKYRNQATLAVAYSNHAEFYTRLGKEDSAGAYLNKAIDIYESLAEQDKISYQYSLFHSQVEVGKLLNSTKFYKEAIDTIKRILPAIEKGGYKKISLMAYRALTQSFASLKLYPESYEYSSKAITMLDSLLNDDKSLEIANGLQIKYDVKKKEMENLALRYANIKEKSLSLIATLQRDSARQNSYLDSIRRISAEQHLKLAEYSKDSLVLVNNIITLKIEQQRLKLDADQKDKKNFIILLIAVAILSALVITVIALFYRNKIAKSDLDIATMNAEKLQQENELQKAELSIRRLQMNPHTIVNQINAVIEYGKENPQEAEIYYNKLLYVTDSFLTNSKEEYVTLSSELDIIRDYCDLKYIRLKNFSYVIDISDAIDSHHTYLPPSLLYPFVENATHHGFKFAPGKRKDGLLAVKISLDGELLAISISDDGMGSLLRKHSGPNDSFAVKNTRARIDMENETHHFSSDFKLDISSTGTTVEFKLYARSNNSQKA